MPFTEWHLSRVFPWQVDIYRPETLEALLIHFFLFWQNEGGPHLV